VLLAAAKITLVELLLQVRKFTYKVAALLDPSIFSHYAILLNPSSITGIDFYLYCSTNSNGRSKEPTLVFT